MSFNYFVIFRENIQNDVILLLCGTNLDFNTFLLRIGFLHMVLHNILQHVLLSWYDVTLIQAIMISYLCYKAFCKLQKAT